MEQLELIDRNIPKGMVELLPNTQRLRQLIKAHGRFWWVRERRAVQCFSGPGVLIEAPGKTHTRWVRPEDIKETA